MHSQESGPTSQGGSKPDPLAFFPGVCSGGYLFSSGGPTPTTPANFYPVQFHYHEGSPVGKRSLRWEGLVKHTGFEPGVKE